MYQTVHTANRAVVRVLHHLPVAKVRLVAFDDSKTQLLIENNDLKKELRKVREKLEENTSVLNDMLQELERHQPEFDELRRQNDAVNEQKQASKYDVIQSPRSSLTQL